LHLSDCKVAARYASECLGPPRCERLENRPHVTEGQSTEPVLKLLVVGLTQSQRQQQTVNGVCQ
jgi:hypothetical protein